MNIPASLRSVRRKGTRTGAIGAFIAALVLADGAIAGAGGEPPAGPDLVEVMNEFFASDASEDVKEGLGWTKLPTPIQAGDAPNDQHPLDDASAEASAPGDLLGFSHARSGAIAGDSRARLLRRIQPYLEGDSRPDVFTPDGYEIDPGAFADGSTWTFVQNSAPFSAPTAPGSSFIVAVVYFDPRYPAPADGSFAGINKAHRLEIRPEGSRLAYLQFDGTTFRPYRSDVIVIDTCAISTQTVCGWLFGSATSGIEHEGITQIGVEQFWGTATTSITDRIGSGLGNLVPIEGGRPGELGLVPIVAAPDPEDPNEGEANEEEPSDLPELDPGDAPVAVGGDTGDSDGGGTNVLVPAIVIIGVGSAAGGTYTVVRRRRRRPTPTALSYTTVETTAPRDADATRARWQQLLAAEDEVQQRLLDQYNRVAEPLASGMQALAGSMTIYQDGFGEVLWEAKNLQRIADENQASMEVTKKMDLALGIADAGRTVFSFGKWGWVKLFGAGDEVGEVAIDTAVATGRGSAYGGAELAVANAKIAESPELLEIANAAGMVTITTHVHWTKFNRGLDVIFSEAAVLADRAGSDFVKAATSRVNAGMAAGDLENGIVALWVDMAEAAAQAKGFVKASEETRSLLTTVTINARTYCNGGVVGSLDELRGVVDGFAAAAAQPGFFNTAPNLYTVVGGAGSGLSGLGRGDTALELLYNADDIAFMRWLSDAVNQGRSFDELPGLWQASMGPIARAGDGLAQGVGGALHSDGLGVATVYSLTQGINNAMETFTPFTTPTTVSSILPDATSYVAQYGIMRPTFLGFEAGDSFGLTMLYNGLNGVGGFATWLNGMRASLEADLLYTGGPPIIGDIAQFVLPPGATGNLMEDTQPTLRSMANASLDIVNSIQMISERVQRSQIDIGDRRQLESLLGEMEATVTAASPEVRDELAPRLEERRAHITTKLGQLESVQSTLVQASYELPAIAAALDQQVSSGRTTIQWADPALLQGFTVASNITNLTVAGVLRPPVTTARD